MAAKIEEDLSGLYGLCVFNANNMSDEEVTDIFGKYGEIAINRSKDLLFVKYRMWEEANWCYEDMKNHKNLKVMPARRKTSDTQRRSVGFNGNQKNRYSGFSKNEIRSPRDTASTKKLPKLVHDVPTPAETESKPPRPLRRVVLGNLPHGMMQLNVNKLCTKAGTEPLHIDMKTMTMKSFPTMFYAVAHVRTDKDVQNLIKSLNNLKINNHSLIVEPYDTLVQNGKEISVIQSDN